jgi:ribosomal protein S20
MQPALDGHGHQWDNHYCVRCDDCRCIMDSCDTENQAAIEWNTRPTNKNDESWSMLKTTIEATKQAVEIGIENTQELLSDFDIRFGRTTRSNRLTAERLEAEIKTMNNALSKLTHPDGCAYSKPLNKPL